MKKNFIDVCKQILTNRNKIHLLTLEDIITTLNEGEVVWTNLNQGIMFFRKRENFEIYITNFKTNITQRYLDMENNEYKVLKAFFENKQLFFYIPNKDIDVNVINFPR